MARVLADPCFSRLPAIVSDAREEMAVDELWIFMYL
jgi:hypothetical protein